MIWFLIAVVAYLFIGCYALAKSMPALTGLKRPQYKIWELVICITIPYAILFAIHDIECRGERDE